MRTLVLLSVLFLTACGSVPEKEIVYETKTVTRLPPPELLVVPPAVEPVDLNTATEADVARFVKDIWDRMVALESNVIGVAVFFKDANEVPDDNETR